MHHPIAIFLLFLVIMTLLQGRDSSFESALLVHAFVSTSCRVGTACLATRKNNGRSRLSDNSLQTYQRICNGQSTAQLRLTCRKGHICMSWKKNSVQRLPATEKISSPSSSSFVTPESSCSCVETTLVHHHGTSSTTRKNRVQTIVTSMSFFCWILSMLSHAAHMFLLRHHWRVARLLSKLRYAALVSVALALPTVASKAKRAIFHKRKVDSSCMMLAASLGALILGEFTESAAVTSLYAVSEILEDRAANRSSSALSQVARDMGPGRARLFVSSDGVSNDALVSTTTPTTTGSTGPVEHSEMASSSEQTINVSADQVNVGESVSVPVGEKIPCDGVIGSGHTFLDESSITGESRPSRRTTGYAVSAGCVNAGPERIIVRTTAMASDSAVARLAKLVEESMSQKSHTEVMVDEFAGQYAPIVFFIALVMATVPWVLGSSSDLGRVWTRRGLVTMVAACPCPLVISTPVSYIAALAVTAQEGIIVKGGAILEGLGRVNKIALDKTGTITEGDFSLRNFIVTADGFGKKEAMEYLLLMEAPSLHPLASAVVHAARKEGINPPKNVTVKNHTVLKGEGLVADIGGKKVHVGNQRLFERLGLYDQLSDVEKELAINMESAGETVVFLSLEGSGIICMYSVADAIRDEAPDVVKQLEKKGIQVNMLTGDSKGSAMAVAERIGIPPSQVYSQLLPEDKLRIITLMKGSRLANDSPSRRFFRWRRTGRRDDTTLMCGDGVNDAPALALADISVAMGSGSYLATKTSDVILTDSSLKKLLDSIMIGRRVARTILQNITISLVTKGVVVGLAAFGITSLWAAIVSDVGTMLVVTSNGLRILSTSTRSRDKL